MAGAKEGGGKTPIASPAERLLTRQASGEPVALPGYVRTCVFEASSSKSIPIDHTEEEQIPEAAVARPRGERFFNGLVALYLFAFWSQFKPSEPFLVDFLTNNKGLTGPQVYKQVFDLFIYARLPCVALVGYISWQPWGSNRKVLVVGAACGFVTVLLTRFGASLAYQQSAQFTVAAAFASRVACPAMAFAIASPQEYQKSVHTLKAVMLFSNFASAAAGEFLRDVCGVSLEVLFDLSAVGQAISLACALLLPGRTPEEQGGDQDFEAPTGDVVESPVAEATASRDGLWFFKELLLDLKLLLYLRRVLWWTLWALWMNPVHGLAMTYWQGLVRSKDILSDHNGTLLACMYLIAAVFTLISGSTPQVRGQTAMLVVGSMLLAGVVLLGLVQQTEQWSIYLWLLCYQCLFEVTTAISTYQVGAEVTLSSGCQGSPTRRRTAAHMPVSQTARLTFLFSATSIASTTNENIILFAVNKLDMSDRFFSLGVCLSVVACVLGVARVAEDTFCAPRKPVDGLEPLLS